MNTFPTNPKAHAGTLLRRMMCPVLFAAFLGAPPATDADVIDRIRSKIHKGARKVESGVRRAVNEVGETVEEIGEHAPPPPSFQPLFDRDGREVPRARRYVAPRPSRSRSLQPAPYSYPPSPEHSRLPVGPPRSYIIYDDRPIVSGPYVSSPIPPRRTPTQEPLGPRTFTPSQEPDPVFIPSDRVAATQEEPRRTSPPSRPENPTSPAPPEPDPDPKPDPETAAQDKETGQDDAVATAAADSPHPVAEKVPGREGIVYSPFAEEKKFVDVRGLPPGTTVEDPYTQKRFLVP